MKFVIDANILFASLIKEGINRQILLHEKFYFYVPKLILDEFLEHIEELEIKTHLKARALKGKTKEFFRLANIKIVDEREIADFLEKAERISPDIDDTIYLALALKLNCPIWSNDLRLKHQNKVNIYSTKELIKRFMLE